MISILGVALASCSGRDSGQPDAPVALVDLQTEYKTNPLGIDVARPRFAWRLQSEARGITQTAYQVRVASSESALRDGTALIWDSTKVTSAESTQIAYAGQPLQSRFRYYWQVRVWSGQGTASEWSAPASWEMGFLEPEAWKARWIQPDIKEDRSKASPTPLLRTQFELQGNIARARAYVTSRGIYELYLNGQRVGDQLFTPGWTSYNKRLQYQTYDVTQLLKQGQNAVGAMLGDGWYRGRLGLADKRNVYGDKLALLAQIEVVYEDGRVQTVITDSDWKAATGPIQHADIYNGEAYDARAEREGWAQPGFEDHDWSGVSLAEPVQAALIASVGPPVRRIEEIKPVRIFKSPNGQTVADLGQNMVGWIRLRVSGPAGTSVTLRHAEVLNTEGNIYTENLRSAQQKVVYILKGKGSEVYEPHFTFQGFRYVAVDGYPGELQPDSVTGIVIHSDMKVAGTLKTSSDLLNQLQHNIVWGQKGNFLDVPTDCPQRDERLGWTGDAQVFSSTAAFNMNVQGFFAKWLGDLAADQLPSGSVPWVIPALFLKSSPDPLWGKLESAGAAGWGDAATVIPWNMYLEYGDRGILDAQYPSMVRWVEWQQSRAGDDLIWSGDFQFGDWLDFFTTSSKEGKDFGSTSPDLVSTAYFAHSSQLLSRTAKVLGKADDAAKYSALFDTVRDAFVKKFLSAEGKVGEGTQTAYVLALDFDLLPEARRRTAANHLAEDVRTRGHLTTGFLGTPRLLNVLSRFGHLDEAYALLNRQEFPSWLYPVRNGATTIWERWDGIKPDGSFQSVKMNSFNHYAYGAVGEWMYRTIAGINIDAEAPGYKRILIEPRPGGGLTNATATHLTPYGEVSSSWRIEAGTFHLVTEIPPNTTALVTLPSASVDEVKEGAGPVVKSNGISAARQTGPDVTVDVGSGRYEFSYPLSSNRDRAGL